MAPKKPPVISIKIQLPEAPPEKIRKEFKKPTLEEKVDYALECMHNDYKTDKAITFLRKVYNKLNKAHQKTEEMWALMERITPVMNNFGNIPGHEDKE